MSQLNFHHAFKIEYPLRVRELKTFVKIVPISSNPISPTKQVTALWDTGATNTVITPQVVQEFKLTPTGITEVRGVNSVKKVNTYIINLMLPNNVIIPNLNVSESDLGGDIDVLIGMDIIQLGDFNISNAGNKTTFTYCLPSHQNPVCLLEKSNKVNSKNKTKPFNN